MTAITLNGSYLPEAKQTLLLSSDAPLYHTAYGLRHPLAIYNVSYSAVLNNFNKIITTLAQVAKEKPFLITAKKDGNKEILYNLLVNQKDLLYSLMEHLDDCENILLCFFSSKSIRNKNIHVKSYRKATEEYRDYIGKVVNYLKHEQGRLRPITFYSDEFSLPGYYVEGPISENVLGPVEKIHPGGSGAFSFARDLRYNFFHFYAISKHLSTAIRGLLSSEHAPNPSGEEASDKSVLEIASGISSLPLVFYPDEVLQPIPNVTTVQDNMPGITIILTYPDNETKVDVPPKGTKIFVEFRGDGVTRSFRLPYRKSEEDQ